MANFHVAKVGEIDRQWTIITAGAHEWEIVEYMTTIYEADSKEFLIDVLNLGNFKEVAEFMETTEKRIEKLRQRMRITMHKGGDRRSKQFYEKYSDVDGATKSRIALLGETERSLLLISNRPTDWVRVPRRQIVYEAHIADRLADWLRGVGNADAAAHLGVAISKIKNVRKVLDAPSPHYSRRK